MPPKIPKEAGNLINEINKLVISERNLEAFNKLLASPIKDIADIHAKSAEELFEAIVSNINDKDEMRKAIQAFMLNNVTTPILVMKTLLKFK